MMMVILSLKKMDDFEAFARRRAQEDFTRVDFLDSLSLGTWETDRGHD